MAFVVDTAGRVQYRTITFMNDVAPHLRAPICGWMMERQFTPASVAGTPRRVVRVEELEYGDFSAASDRRRGVARRSTVLTDSLHHETLEQLWSRMDGRPHCHPG